MMAVVSSDEKKDFYAASFRVGRIGQFFMSKSIYKAQRFLMPCTICKIGGWEFMDIRQVTETIAMIEEQNF